MKVIQLLNWKLESIEKELENIKEQGFDAIQINPMQPFKQEKEFHWWSSYQPLGFRVGNMFGTKEDLKRLCEKVKEYDIDIIVDVVLNHVANKDCSHPCEPSEKVDKEILDRKDFFKTKLMIRDGDNRFSATTENIGLPGLDLSNDDLQNIMFRYLTELKECGVKGLRFDASKHIGLPKDGVNFFKRVKMFLLLNGMYGYGEFLGGNQNWRDEMAKYIDVLTPADSLMTNNNKKVAFFESHDTYLNFDQKFHTRNLTEQDYIYIYKKLRNMFKNTLVYVSPIDENGPFGKNKDNLTCEEVLKLNEQEYFKRVYLENERIKDINNKKEYGLVLKRKI